MDPSNFDELARSLAAGRSRRSVLRGLVGGGAALAAMRADSSLAAGKVTICHYPPGNPANVQILSVSASAVAAHVANHGDTVLGTVDSCTGCGDVCRAVDACTPASCTANGCTVQSSCTAVDTCTPAACVGGACNTVSACGAGQVCGDNGCETVSVCPNIVLGEPACFWLDCEIYHGECCWDLNGFPASSRAECQHLDSCSPGGGGASGGGCYKWGTSSLGPAIAPPW